MKMKAEVGNVIIDNVIIPGHLIMAIMKSVIIYPGATVTINSGPNQMLHFTYLGECERPLLRVLLGAVGDSVFGSLVFIKGIPYLTQ